MADYRQFCGTCGSSIGFGSGHKAGCPAPERERQWELERKAERERLRDEGEAPWKRVLEEQGEEALFERIAIKEMFRDEAYEPYAKLKAETDAALEVVAHQGDSGMLSRWLKWKREKREEARRA